MKVVPSFLKVSTEWIELEILSEPNVVITFHGYAPYVIVKIIRTSVEYGFYISAKSLAVPLEELRKVNNGYFTGIKFRVRKESMDKIAKYELHSYKHNHELPIGESDQDKTNLTEDIQKKLEQVLSKN